MKILTIIKSVRAKRVNITHHAKEEAKNDLLLLDDIFKSIYNGEIIEDYPPDKPFPSCLIMAILREESQFTASGLMTPKPGLLS